MALTTEQDEHLTLLLEGLGAARSSLNATSRGFVDDQIKRHDEYGDHIFLSPRQLKWLEDLYREHVGDTETVDVRDAEHTARSDMKDDRDPRNDEDMDSDIPF